MADFSKEWCEEFDPDMPHDFSIKEIFDKLEPEYFRTVICEGYGFLAIERDKDNNCLLWFRDPDESVDKPILVPLEQLSEYSKKRYYNQ